MKQFREYTSAPPGERGFAVRPRKRLACLSLLFLPWLFGGCISIAHAYKMLW